MLPEGFRLFVPYLGPSTNAVYAGLHWGKRKAEKDASRLMVANAVRSAGLMPCQSRVDLVFSPRLGKGDRMRDTSNYSLTAKLIEDGLVNVGILADDTARHVRRVILEPATVDRSQPGGMWVKFVMVPEAA